MTPTLNDIFTPLTAIAACTQTEFTGVRGVVDSIDASLVDTTATLKDIQTKAFKTVTTNQDNLLKAMAGTAAIQAQAIASSSAGATAEQADFIVQAVVQGVIPLLQESNELLDKIADSVAKSAKTAAKAASSTPPPVPKEKAGGTDKGFLGTTEASVNSMKNIVDTVKDISLKDIVEVRAKLPLLKKIMKTTASMLKEVEVKDIKDKKEDYEALADITATLPEFYANITKASAWAVLASLLLGKDGKRLVNVAESTIDALKVFSEKKDNVRATSSKALERVRDTGKTAMVFMAEMALAGVLALPAIVGAAGFRLTSKIAVAGMGIFTPPKDKDDPLAIANLNRVKRVGKTVMVFMAEMALGAVLTPVALVGAAGFVLAGMLTVGGVALVSKTLDRLDRGLKSSPVKKIEKLGLGVLTFMASMVLVSVMAPVAAIGVEASSLLMMTAAKTVSKIGGKRMSKNIRNGVINIALMSLGFFVFSASFLASATMVREFWKGGDAGDNVAGMVGSVALFGLMLGSMYVMKGLGKGVKNIAFGAAASALMGVGLVVFGYGMKIAMGAIKGYDWEDMFRIPAMLGVFGAEFAALGIPVVAGCIALGTAATIGMATGLTIFSLGLRLGASVIAGVDEDDRNWLMKSIGLFGAEFTALGLLSIPISLGSAAMATVSGSLALLAGSMAIFQKANISTETTDLAVDIIKRVPQAISDSAIGPKVVLKAAGMAPVGVSLAVFAHGVRIAAEHIKAIGDLGDLGSVGKIDFNKWQIQGGDGPLLALQNVFVGLYNVFDAIGNKMIESQVSNFLSSPVKAIIGAVATGGGNPIVVALRSFTDVGRVVRGTALAFGEVMKIAGDDLGEAGEVQENWTVSGGSGAIGAVQNMFAGLYGVFKDIGDHLYDQLITSGGVFTGPRLFRMFESPKSSLQLAISSFSGVGKILESTVKSFNEVSKFNLKALGTAGEVSDDWTVSGGGGAIGAVQNMFAGLYGVFGRIGDHLWEQLAPDKEGNSNAVYTGPKILRIFESPKNSLQLALSSFSGVGEIIKNTTEGFKTAIEMTKKGGVKEAIGSVQEIFWSLFLMFDNMGVFLQRQIDTQKAKETAGQTSAWDKLVGAFSSTKSPLELAIYSFGGVGGMIKDTVEAFTNAAKLSEEQLGTMGTLTTGTVGKWSVAPGSKPGALFRVQQMMTGLFNIFGAIGMELAKPENQIEVDSGFLGMMSKTENPLSLGIGSFGGIGEIVKDSVNAFKTASEMSADVMGIAPVIRIDPSVGMVLIGGSGAMKVMAQTMQGPFNLFTKIGAELADDDKRERFMSSIDIMADMSKSSKKMAGDIKGIMDYGLTEEGLGTAMGVMRQYRDGAMEIVYSFDLITPDELRQAKAVHSTMKKMFSELQKLDTGVKGTFHKLATDYNKGVKTLTNGKGIEKVTAFVNAMIRAKSNRVWDNLSKNMKEVNESLNGLSADIIDPLSKMVVAMQEMSTHAKNSKEVLEEMKKAAEKLKEALEAGGNGGSHSESENTETSKTNPSNKAVSNPSGTTQQQRPQSTTVTLNGASTFESAVADFRSAVNDFVSKSGT